MLGSLLLLATISSSQVQSGTKPLSFSVSWTREQFGGNFTGRAYIVLTSDKDKEPRLLEGYIDPHPVFQADFKNINPDATLDFNDTNSVGYPQHLSNIPEGDYTIQAIMDRNLDGGPIGSAGGNIYSNPLHMHISSHSGPIHILCDQMPEAPEVATSAFVKEDNLESKVLSDALRRSVVLEATVMLPKSYVSGNGKKYATIVEVPDFHQTNVDMVNQLSSSPAGNDEVIKVVLNPRTQMGDRIFIDSKSAGPWGTAVSKDLLPYLEHEYPIDPTQMSVSGAGTGGYSALWLQAAFPDTFISSWALSPSLTSMRDWQGLNLFKATQAFTTDSGAVRKSNRTGAEMKTWVQAQQPVRDELLPTLDDTFSIKGKNGKIIPLIDPLTGNIDPLSAASWQSFDLATIYSKLKPEDLQKLHGHVHIFVDKNDSDFRDDAVSDLQAQLQSQSVDLAEEVKIEPQDDFNSGVVASYIAKQQQSNKK